MCIPSGGAAASAQAGLAQKQADEARADTDKKAAALRTGMGNIDSVFSGFNDDYFANLSKDYLNYAQPQLDDQYNQEKKNLTYSLARKGNLASTVAGDQQALLDKQYGQNLTGVVGTAGDYARQARQDVQSAKQDVVGQLNSTYDVDAANTSALSASRALAAPPSFSPLGSMFSDVAAVAAQSKLASDSRGGYGSAAGARLYGGGNAGYGVTL